MDWLCVSVACHGETRGVVAACCSPHRSATAPQTPFPSRSPLPRSAPMASMANVEEVSEAAMDTTVARDLASALDSSPGPRVKRIL